MLGYCNAIKALALARDLGFNKKGRGGGERPRKKAEPLN